jgi:hypothetical protein
MVTVFRQLIQEFHGSDFTEPLSPPPAPAVGREAVLFIGMSKSEREWIGYQIRQDLLENGIDATQVVHINFGDERLKGISKSNLQDSVTSYFEAYPEYQESSDIHFIFEDIQEIPGWETFILQLLEETRIHIYIMGSANKTLSKEITSTFKEIHFTGTLS